MNGQRVVNAEMAWINAHTSPPPLGTKVQVLNRDGVQAGSTVWTRSSIKQFDAWLPHAKIPADVRALQVARYQPY